MSELYPPQCRLYAHATLRPPVDGCVSPKPARNLSGKKHLIASRHQTLSIVVADPSRDQRQQREVSAGEEICVDYPIRHEVASCLRCGCLRDFT